MKKIILLIFVTPFYFNCVSQNEKFTKYRLPDIGSIEISNAMELQGGDYKSAGNIYNEKVWGTSLSNRIVFQQNGVNEYNSDAFSTYARIIIFTESGSFSPLKGERSYSTKELDDWGNELKSEITNVLDKQGATIIKWHGGSVKKINNQNAVVFSYSRKLKTNPPTMVYIYYFENSDRRHKVNLEYWAKDESRWKHLLERSIGSFIITKNQ